MSQITRVSRQRPKRKILHVSSVVLQWSIVAVVAVVMLFLLVRALTNKPVDTPPIPMLANAHTDLSTITRMLGDIRLDSATRSLFPPAVQARLASADTLSSQGRWNDAINSLYSLLRGRRAADVAAVRAYLGFCYYQAASPDYALMHLRKSLALADTALPTIRPWLFFSIGYLFEVHGMQDSALLYYERYAAGLRAGDRGDSATVLNNMAASREAKGDRADAIELFRVAAGIDSSADEHIRQTILDNLARAGAPAQH